MIVHAEASAIVSNVFANHRMSEKVLLVHNPYKEPRAIIMDNDFYHSMQKDK